MRRGLSDHCVRCKLPFVIGPLFVDYIPQLRQRGLRSTLHFDYRLYEDWYGHPRSDEWPAQVTLANCDSVYLGDVIDSAMRCPKCGGFAFPQDDE